MIVVQVEEVVNQTNVTAQTTEVKVVVRTGDEELAKQFALASQLAAIAAGESETNAGASEQVTIQNATQTAEDAASALESKQDAEIAASDSGGFASDSGISATASEAAKVLSEEAKGIAIEEAGKSGTSAGQSAASAAAAEAAKNLSVSAKNTAISNAGEASSSAFTATQQAGISTDKANESAASAFQSLTSRNEAAEILANTLSGVGIAGQVSFWNAPKNLIGDGGFVWDNVNKRLGVGTSSPGFPLSVNGVIESGFTSGNGELRSYENTSRYVSLKTDHAVNKSGLFRSNTAFFVYYETNNGTTVLDATFANQPISFRILGVEAGRFSASGNFSVGSTEGSGKVQIQKNATNGDTSAFTLPHLKLTAVVVPDITGFVGITFATSSVDNNGYSAGSQRTTGGQGDFKINYHQFSAAGVNRFIVKQTGFVGIGISTPTEVLDVNGKIRVRLVDNEVGNIANYSATGVLQQRTPLQHINDILTALPTYNAAIFQTLTHNASGLIAWT